MGEQILIAEDDADINNLLAKILRTEHFKPIQAFSGTEAKLLFMHNTPDLILLDLMLPGLSGEELLSELRENLSSDVPVIILSAKIALADKVSLLKMGADDYITKPFLPLEFVARVKALFRRSDPHFYDAGMTDPVTRFVCGNLVLFPVSHRVTIQERDLNVTPTEFDFLLYMIQRADNAVSKKELAEQVWHFQGPDPEADIPEDFIKRLRKKLLSFGSTALIETVWGFGYRMSERRPEGIESI